MPPPATALTDEAYWDAYWEELPLPSEVRRGSDACVDSILDVFDRWLPVGTCLEIGGAPGQYLAYLQRRGSRVTALDISPRGCQKTRANFALLEIPGDVCQGDLFTARLGRFDVVYSLGLIEHFIDATSVVRAHLRHLAADGTLLIGCPNLRLLNGWLMQRTAPSVMAHVERSVIAVSTWDAFERELGLVRIWRGFVGGFEPAMFWRQESRRLRDRVLGKALRTVRVPEASRTWNSRLWSGYLIGVYRVQPRSPSDRGPSESTQMSATAGHSFNGSR